MPQALGLGSDPSRRTESLSSGLEARGLTPVPALVASRRSPGLGGRAMVVTGFNSGKGGDPMVSGILKSAMALLDHAVVGATSDRS